MKKVIVSDASPLIALAKLDCLELLFCSFAEIHLPNAVFMEVTTERRRKDAQHLLMFAERYKGKRFFIHDDLTDTNYKSFKELLDEGESQALSLATSLNCAILIDEKLGRAIASRYSIPVIGVLGVLLKAKESGEINLVKPLIESLQENNYRLSDRVINIVLQRAGEG